jgi:hypothetical protein
MLPLESSDTSRFDREAYERFALPQRIGHAISCWDHPEAIPAGLAEHMRDDDLVVGVAHDGVARAYPLWAIDYHHVINDQLGRDRVVVTSCERCQSGSAFLAEPAGNPERPPMFRAVGLLDAVLLIKDVRAGTYWNHYDGHALKGRGAGTRLPWIPTYHMEWKEWRDLHPETDVMLPPADPGHPDARHGHGREEFFCRPGVEVGLIPTIRGDPATGYPENEIVLGIDNDEPVAYPLSEVQRAGGVVDDDVRGPVVVFAGPALDGFSMAAFEATANGGEARLSFVRVGHLYRDAATGSTWTIDGRAVEGPLRGQRLRPVRSFCVRWHAWFYVHRRTRIFRSDRPWPRLSEREDPRILHAMADEGIGRLLRGLVERGHDLLVTGPMVSQRRPNRSVRSITCLVDAHRVHVHRFGTVAAARDFAAFEAAWSMLPLKTRVGESRVFRAGTLVVQSDPLRRFLDPTQWIQLPPAAMQWAPVLKDQDLRDLTQGEPDGPDDEVSFIDLVAALKAASLDVTEMGLLPRAQLRPGSLDGVALTIDGDRFLLYRFGSRSEATRYAHEQGHTLAVGQFAFRSTPETMYVHAGYEILYRGDDVVAWSTLLASRKFRVVLEAKISATAKRT